MFTSEDLRRNPALNRYCNIEDEGEINMMTQMINDGGTRVLARAKKQLEVERHSAANRACRLHQIHRPAILAHDRHIALRQQIADFEQDIHVSRQ